MARIQISFTNEEYARIAQAAAKAKVPVNLYCKDIILAADIDNMKSKEGSFVKNHAKLMAEMKSYAAKHSGTFQLRDLKSWAKVVQGTFDGEEVYPLGIRSALGRAILKDVENGLIPNVRVSYSLQDGKRVPQRDQYGIIIYEIVPSNPDEKSADYIIEETEVLEEA